MSRKSRLAARLIGAAVLTAGLASGAQAFPDKTIRLVVGFAAGGPTDLPARMIADKLGPMLGGTVVVENRVGASGLVAARYVLSQPADGHTLLLCTHFESINAVLYKTPPYKIEEITPVSLISLYYYGFAISNSLPVNTFEEFIEYAKARPDELNSATSATQAIMMNQFEKATGIQMTRIQYNSTPVIVQEMIAGRAHFNGNPISGLVQPHKAGQLKLIAVSGPERMAEIPDVPTLQEKGIDNIYASGWLGVCAKSGTPREIIDTLNGHIRTIVASDDYRALLERGGSNPVSSTPEELQTMITDTLNVVEPTILEFNMQQD